MMTPPSASPSKFGGILFNRHALLLVLLASAQLIPSIQGGFECYDCAYERRPLKAGQDKDYPCHKLNDKRPSITKDCGGSDGCFSMHVRDHSKGADADEAWGYGSCLDPFKDKSLHCILAHPAINITFPNGVFDIAHTGSCAFRNLSPKDDFEIRSKCLDEKEAKEPDDTPGELSYDLCPCSGALCRLPAYPGAPTLAPVAPPAPPPPAETTAPDVPAGSATSNAAGLLQVLTIAGVLVAFWTTSK